MLRFKHTIAEDHTDGLRRYLAVRETQVEVHPADVLMVTRRYDGRYIVEIHVAGVGPVEVDGPFHGVTARIDEARTAWLRSLASESTP